MAKLFGLPRAQRPDRLRYLLRKVIRRVKQKLGM
jgi:hypothetical protein